MKHKIQSLTSEGEPFCKVPRIVENQVWKNDSLASLIVTLKQGANRKRVIPYVTCEEMESECEMKKMKAINKENVLQLPRPQTNSDPDNLMDSTNGYVVECKSEESDFSCYNFWRLPLPDTGIDLIDIG